MSKSSALPYHPPFRYSRPAKDLQAVFGAQTGNPPVVREEKAKAGKPARVKSKRSSAPAGKPGKASQPKAAVKSKVAPGKAKAKAKAKKTVKKR